MWEWDGLCCEMYRNSYRIFRIYHKSFTFHPKSHTQDQLICTESTAPVPLTVVQITDPHLGAYMTRAQLRGICEGAIAVEGIDLIVLTGDYHTPGSDKDPA